MQEKKEIVIDAKGAVVGRLSSFAAKKALQGNSVIVVNSEKAIMIGRPKDILEKYLKRYRLGHGVQKGPIYSRRAELILKRAIRGMIGRKKSKGRDAFKRIRCYVGIPEKYVKAEKIIIFKKKALNFITLGKLDKLVRQK